MQNKNMKKFKCSQCTGKGYSQIWESNTPKDEHLEIKDCESCKGKGILMLEVEDLRKVSKKRKLYVKGEY